MIASLCDECDKLIALNACMKSGLTRLCHDRKRLQVPNLKVEYPGRFEVQSESITKIPSAYFGAANPWFVFERWTTTSWPSVILEQVLGSLKYIKYDSISTVDAKPADMQRHIMHTLDTFNTWTLSN